MKFNDKKGISEIMCACAEIEGMSVEYTLLSLGCGFRPVYAIEIKDRNESRISFFGIDKKRAVSIFELVVNNAVTPCTLEDIAEDMEK
jgi:hypothetical protein